jgi:hypothetical protein
VDIMRAPLEEFSSLTRSLNDVRLKRFRTLLAQGKDVAASPEAIHPIVTGGAGYKMAYLPIWGGGSQMVMRKL